MNEQAEARVAVPLEGEIGSSGLERVFCRLAHEAAAGLEDDVVVEETLDCPQLRHCACGLTGHQCLCLFWERSAAEWVMIQKSLALQ